MAADAEKIALMDVVAEIRFRREVDREKQMERDARLADALRKARNSDTLARARAHIDVVLKELVA